MGNKIIKKLCIRDDCICDDALISMNPSSIGEDECQSLTESIQVISCPIPMAIPVKEEQFIVKNSAKYEKDIQNYVLNEEQLLNSYRNDVSSKIISHYVPVFCQSSYIKQTKRFLFYPFQIFGNLLKLIVSYFYNIWVRYQGFRQNFKHLNQYECEIVINEASNTKDLINYHESIKHHTIYSLKQYVCPCSNCPNVLKIQQALIHWKDTMNAIDKEIQYAKMFQLLNGISVYNEIIGFHPKMIPLAWKLIQLYPENLDLAFTCFIQEIDKHGNMKYNNTNVTV